MLNEQNNYKNEHNETKLLIIGNGFDLAHGLKTEYMDFIGYLLDNVPDFFEKIKTKYDVLSKSAYINIHFLDQLFSKVNNWINLEENLANSISVSNDDELMLLTEIFNEYLLPYFEDYVATQVNKVIITPVFKTDFLSSFTDVICFNYSNTYERLYFKLPQHKKSANCNRHICYINGKALSNVEKSNIVFGCDEYDADNENITWFNKSFQRTLKSTDDSYKKLHGKRMSITIIGHSLGETDHHIIKPLISSNSYNEIKIYYHNHEWHHRLIHRTMAMLGTNRFENSFISFKDIKEIVTTKPHQHDDAML